MNPLQVVLTNLSAWFDAARRDRLLRHIKSRSWRTALRKAHARPEDFSEKGRDILFHPYGCLISPAAWTVLRGFFQRLCAIKKARPDATLESADGVLFFKVGGIKIHLSTVDEAFILEEIFLSGIYNFSKPGPCVVWDIGANVGISALFFSQLEQVAAVHAFEPFPDTAAAANANFDLNPGARRKISLMVAGVSDRHGSVECAYNPDVKGRMSVTGSSPVQADAHLSKKNVTLLPASEVLSSIIEAHPGLPVVAKIDCEGSETEILAQLAGTGMLKRLSLLMIEWHGPTREPVLHCLHEAGFTAICQVSEPDLGLIYAVRPADRD